MLKPMETCNGSNVFCQKHPLFQGDSKAQMKLSAGRYGVLNCYQRKFFSQYYFPVPINSNSA